MKVPDLTLLVHHEMMEQYSMYNPHGYPDFAVLLKHCLLTIMYMVHKSIYLQCIV